MTELEAFLTAIQADPGDSTAWLVFADWLDDHADPRAGRVRVAGDGVEVLSYFRGLLRGREHITPYDRGDPGWGVISADRVPVWPAERPVLRVLCPVLRGVRVDSVHNRQLAVRWRCLTTGRFLSAAWVGGVYQDGNNYHSPGGFEFLAASPGGEAEVSLHISAEDVLLVH